MEIEILHTFHGDKKKKFDTSTEAGRQQTAIFLNKLVRQGTAVLLERGKKTFYIKKYDPKTDSLVVTTEHHNKVKEVRASGKKSKAVAVPRAAGGLNECYCYNSLR